MRDGSEHFRAFVKTFFSFDCSLCVLLDVSEVTTTMGRCALTLQPWHYLTVLLRVTGLNYSPTGALYSSASKAYLERNNYSPTGALYSPWARNVARLATELIPSKREAIIKQVEFYFGDSNFPKDKFLQKEVKKKADGYVSLKVIAAFTKLKKLTTSWRVVAKVKPIYTLYALYAGCHRVVCQYVRLWWGGVVAEVAVMITLIQHVGVVYGYAGDRVFWGGRAERGAQ